MKILYVGHLDSGGTCLDRLMSLRRLRHEVVGFDIARFQSKRRILRSAQWRWHPRWLLGELNRGLAETARSIGRIDLCWVDKGIWIFPETLLAIRKATGGRLFHYTPDAQIATNRSRHFLEAIPIYDLLVTTKSFEVDEYRRLAAQRVELVTQSYCPIRFANPTPQAEFAHDVGFISDFKPHYGRVIGDLLSAVPDVGVWGPRWRRAAWMGRVPRAIVKGDGLWNESYVNALASFKIGLGLLSKYIPEQHTTRTFEIPAAGSFLLAERTKEHQEFFKEGEEADFFDSAEELCSKAKFYLADGSARRRIAANGRERCRRSGYDSDSVLGRILEEHS